MLLRPPGCDVIIAVASYTSPCATSQQSSSVVCLRTSHRVKDRPEGLPGTEGMGGGSSPSSVRLHRSSHSVQPVRLGSAAGASEAAVPREEDDVELSADTRERSTGVAPVPPSKLAATAAPVCGS
jgi:hypothetical protein